MRVLNVAEKPSMAKQISMTLANNKYNTKNGSNKYCKLYDFQLTVNNQALQMIFTSVLGHLNAVDFPQSYATWQKVDPILLFDAEIVTKNGESEARHSERLVIWTDCDREGEYIGEEIRRVCVRCNPRIQVFRARYSSLTLNELRRAMDSLSRLDENTIRAVELRIELDLRIGCAFTRYLTLSLRDSFNSLNGHVISYGTCQFPTLGFVVEQFWKWQNFKSERFYSLKMSCKRGHSSKEDEFLWSRFRLFDRAVTAALLLHCTQQGGATISRVLKKPTSKWRPLPLRTVELQKFASNVLKLAAEKTMQIAEKLYNEGFISYPRTETDVFEPDFDHAKCVSLQQGHPTWGSYAAGLLSGGKFNPKRGSNNDKAHPPIHPTSAGASLSGDQARIYEFVCRRYLASISEDARGDETVVSALIGQEEFIAKGLVITSRNYLDIYTYEKWAESEIGQYTPNQRLLPSQFAVTMSAGDTVAPKLLSESDLIATMDKNGIGTDATIHEHIQRILERKYALKNREGRFHPTNLGLGLVGTFDRLSLASSLTKPDVRSKMERDLVHICQGTLPKDQVLRDYIAIFRGILQNLHQNANITRQYMGGYLSEDPFKIAGQKADSESIQGTPAAERSQSAHGTPGGHDAAQQLCACNMPCGIRKVSKEGPNKDRFFYVCLQPSDCNFFQWVLRPSAAQDAPPSDTKCKCGLIAVLSTVRGGENAGRQYLGCSRAYKKCGFFEWKEGGESSCGTEHSRKKPRPAPTRGGGTQRRRGRGTRS